MKTDLHLSSKHRNRSGFATMFFIILLGIMMILVSSNVRNIERVRRTEKLIEQKQIERLNAQTNAIVAASQPAEIK